MKRIRFDYNAGVDNSRKRFRITNGSMKDIIKAGGLGIGEKASFFDPQIGWEEENEGYLTWYGSELIIELG